VDVALPTLAVVLTWLLVGLMLAGCGFLARLALLRVLTNSPTAGLVAADLWVGLAALLAYLQVWSLFLSVNWAAWLAPAGSALIGLALAAPRLRRLNLSRCSPGVLALAAVGTLWVANRALAYARDYDLGLYHLNAIGYALKFPAIPGLGNLQERLGAADAHFVFVAFLEHGPWAGAAPHLAGGLLVSMLFVEVASRFALRPAARVQGSFTDRLALLLVPATIVVIGVRPEYRLSSPNLDLAAFVLFAVGALYLAEAVERDFQLTAALTSTSCFALAAATRPLYWLMTVLAAGWLIVAARRRRDLGKRGNFRSLVLVCALPGALLIGWMTRQAVLSGYPFFPTTIGALPVDWRVPSSVVSEQNRWNASWARWPGRTPDTVLNSWHWLGQWLRAEAKDLDVLAPLLLLAGLVPSLVGRAVADPERRKRAAPMLAILVPVVPTLVVWFVIAPDPRFALGPIWLLSIALAAWALPASTRRPPPTPLLLFAAIVAGGFVALGVRNLIWLILAAFDAWALATLAVRLVGLRRWQDLLAQAAVLSVALAPIGIVAYQGAFDVVVANQRGPLGTPPLPVASLVPFQTNSGLRLWKPAGDSDQCWGATLCAPQPNSYLRLRGTSIRDGFADTRIARGTR
jgi:hypothetical protein